MGTNVYKNTYTKKELIGFLVGMFGQNLIFQVITNGLNFYFQNVICLPAMAVGVIFAVARVWDAINDPMMGTIVDKTRTKWGKCRPYLIIFPGIIGVITIATFLNGNYAEAGSQATKVAIVAWAGVSYILWGMLFTVCDIPLWGITSLMTEDENDRSKIISLARIVAGCAGIAALLVPIAQGVGTAVEGAMKLSYVKGQQYGFIITVIVFTVIGSVMFEFAGVSTKERVEPQTDKKYGFVENFKIMFGNKPFRQILISGILRSPIQLLAVIAFTFFTYYYANGNFMNLAKDGLHWDMIIPLVIIALAFFVGQFTGMGITPVLLKKFEKKTLYNFFSLAGAVPYALIYLIYKMMHGDIQTNILVVLIAGLCFFLASAAFGGLNVLQSVMIADCVDYEEYYNGVRTDGVFFSGQSFITKLSGGIASIISAIAYSAVGYSGANVNKMNEALNAGAKFVSYDGGSGVGKYAATMVFLISIPPAIGMLLSAIPTAKYALSDKEHDRILEELIARRRAKGEDVADDAAVEDTLSAEQVQANIEAND